jgi:uncharacterized protein YecT (DUF1311 family)
MGRWIALVVVLCLSGAAHAQTREPAAQEAAAIKECFAKYDNEDDIEKNCVFKLVAEPCIEKDMSNLGMADCHRIECAIWDRILNENYKELAGELEDKAQKRKLREMQRAWIVSRDRTCEFYQHKIRGSMAIPMHAACMARETARRAMLLKAFQGI